MHSWLFIRGLLSISERRPTTEGPLPVFPSSQPRYPNATHTMTQLLSHLHALRVLLETFHPAAPSVILVALIWLSQWAVRRFVPDVWERIANWPFNGARPAATALRKVWQALPSIATGALLTSLSGSGSITEAVFGAVLGALAPAWHEVLKALPFVPYRGGKSPAVDPWQSDANTPTEPAIRRSRSEPPPSGGNL